MKKLFATLFILVSQFSLITAQEVEVKSAIRSSQNIYQGSARFMGMGGAFTALGADFSSLSLNPAGVGVYTGFQMEFTPSFQYQQVKTSTLSNTHEEFNYNLNLHNMGIVGSYAMNSPGWENINFGFGYNTMHLYNNEARTQTFNKDQSKMHEFVNNAGNGNYRSAYEDLAWQTRLLNYDTAFQEYWSYVTDEMNYTDTSSLDEIGVNQRVNLDNNGSLGEYLLAVGANYQNKLYLGMSVGIQRYQYDYQHIYNESELDNQVPDWKSFNFTQYENHSGTGYNFKIGAIYRPMENIRLGAAFHSPTYFNDLTYIWNNNIRANYDNGDMLEASSGESDWKYKLITPTRITGGVAFKIGDLGMLSADYERVNYGNNRITEMNANYAYDINLINALNDTLSSNGATANNLRLGGELKFSNFYVRLGYAFYQSPIKNGLSYYQSDRQQYSGGIGFRGTSFFFDAAFVTSTYTQDISLFSTIPNISEINFTNNRFIVSVGLRF